MFTQNPLQQLRSRDGSRVATRYRNGWTVYEYDTTIVVSGADYHSAIHALSGDDDYHI